MSKKKLTTSSQRWMQEHFEDAYVKKAQKLGLRSRAVFKIEEINNKDKLIKPGMKVVDLGAAPGGWSEYAVKAVGENGQVVACDILPMDPIVGVDFLQGDFREDAVLDALLTRINGKNIDVVMSDMAASSSGHKQTDHLRIIALCEAAAYLAFDVLDEGGTFVAKVLAGGAEGELQKLLKQKFAKVVNMKPPSSRADSSEKFVVATGFRG